MVNIVLFAPEIAQNTGTIGRSCFVTGTNLHLIKPYNFELSDKTIRKSGLDYFYKLNLFEYSCIDEFLEKHKNDLIYYATTKADKFYTEVKYEENCYIMFGRESSGLPDFVHENNKEYRIKIPMLDLEDARSLNLSNSANIILYEALRQQNFKNLV